MPPPSSHRTEQVCDDFADALRRAPPNGPPPDLEAFLRDLDESERNRLRPILRQLEYLLRGGGSSQEGDPDPTFVDVALTDRVQKTTFQRAAVTTIEYAPDRDPARPRETMMAEQGAAPDLLHGAEPRLNDTINACPNSPGIMGCDFSVDVVPDGGARGSVAPNFDVVKPSPRMASQSDSSLTDHSIAEPGYADGVAPWPEVKGYQILGELGRGGMGVVYKARQKGLRRTVALKMILSGAHAGTQQMARFHTEAEAVARLQHPNIVQIYEVAEQDGLPFFSLEFIDGNPLDKQLGGKPQDPRESAQIIETLARAMHFAHDRGIVHRDLKPANILLTSSGVPKITDFGLAKRLEEVDSGQTKTGTIMGTPGYMSPEQASGNVRAISPLSDLYSLGAMLYEMLTGHPPFTGASAMETVMKVIKDEPVPPSRLQPGTPLDLETICLKCLEKEPNKRYASCFEMAEDLHRYLASEEIQAKPITDLQRFWRWCRRNPKLAASGATILVLLIAGCIGSTWAALTIARERNHKEIERQAAVEARELAVKNEGIASDQARLALETLGILITKVQTQLRDTPGVQQLRRDLLETALDGLKRVANRAGAEGKMQRNLEEGYLKMGIVLMEFGKSKDAAEYFERCYKLTKAALETDPDNDVSKDRLAFACVWLGEIRVNAHRDMQGAMEYYREALRLREEIAQRPDAERQLQNANRRPEDRLTSYAVKTNLSEGYTRVGLNSYFLQDSAQAEGYIVKSLALREELAREQAASFAAWLVAEGPGAAGSPFAAAAAASWQRRAGWETLQNVARNYHLIGEIYFRLQNLAKSREFYEKCAGVREAALAANPRDYKLKGDLAQFYDYYGKMNLGLGAAKEAKVRFDRAIALNREIVEIDKSVAYRRNLAIALYDRGQASARTGDATAAAKSFAECLDIREKLLAGDPNNDVNRMDLMLALARNGQFERAAQLAQSLREGKRRNDREVLLSIARVHALAAAGTSDSTQRMAEEKQAVSFLQNAIDVGLKDVTTLETEPDLDSIRKLPAFLAMVSKLKAPTAVVGKRD